MGEQELAARHYERAAVALIFAAVFDILDGRLARLSGTTSRFGSAAIRTFILS